jgi:hypothetical protein
VREILSYDTYISTSDLMLLPPVWETWTKKDLDNLGPKDCKALQLMMWKKMHMIGDYYDEKLMLLHKERIEREKQERLRQERRQRQEQE